jgi:hypothetical protein
MSLDQPNEYERAIEDYADAVRRQRAAELALEKARQEHGDAINDRQAKWHSVLAHVNQGHTKPGIYRLRKSTNNGVYQEGVLIEQHHDYPELFDMYR